METPTLRDEKEAKILAAARSCFLEFGYAATTTDMVVQRARASKTTLYSRFPSKEALFAATIGAECDAYGLSFTPEEFAELEADEALRRIGRRFVDLILAPETMRMEQVLLSEAQRLPEIAQFFEQEGPERVCSAVAAYFADAVRRGQIDVDDPRFAAEQFLSSLKGQCQHNAWLRQQPTPNGPELDAFVTRAVGLFLNGARKRG